MYVPPELYNPRMLLPPNKDIPLLLAFTCLSQTQAFSKMPLRRDYAQLINESIAKTTFGRVFRLQGCGHVSQATTLLLLGRKRGIYVSAAKRDSWNGFPHRASRWHNNLCDNGIHHCSQRKACLLCRATRC
jgi:hypothetical protein